MMPALIVNCRHSTGSVESRVLPLGSVTETHRSVIEAAHAAAHPTGPPSRYTPPCLINVVVHLAAVGDRREDRAGRWPGFQRHPR